MRHVHVVHDVPEVRVVSRLRYAGRPVEGLVDHVLPVVVTANAVIIVANLAGCKVGQARHLYGPIAVLQVRGTVAVLTTLGIGCRDVGIGIGRIGITESQAGIGDVVVKMNVRAGRNFTTSA